MAFSLLSFFLSFFLSFISWRFLFELLSAVLPYSLDSNKVCWIRIDGLSTFESFWLLFLPSFESKWLIWLYLWFYKTDITQIQFVALLMTPSIDECVPESFWRFHSCWVKTTHFATIWHWLFQHLGLILFMELCI